MGKELKISAENALAAYNNADENGKKMLENLFGKDMFAPKSVMERVKTFDDACRELGSEHPLVKAYDALCCVDTDNNIEAYAKLRIIVTALNEGWKPMFSAGEYRYYPYYYLYTQEEVNKMSEEERSKLLIVGGGADDGAMCGLAFASSADAFSDSAAHIGARLAFKNSELAKYCGKQFVEIWTDYLLG